MSCSAVRQGAVQVITRRTQSLSTSCYRDRRDNKRRAVAAAAAAAGHAGSHGSSVQLFGAPTPERGFLPEIDPNLRLPLPLKDYEDALDALPKLALGHPGTLRAALEALPPFDSCALPALCDASGWPRLPPTGGWYPPQARCDAADSQPLCSDALTWRAYLVLSFLSHAYMWCDGPAVPTALPGRLAVPWTGVSAALGMPPVLVYTTYNLLNWQRLDPRRPIELGNLACQHNFFGGIDEEWFRVVHVAIEAAAAPAIAALEPLQAAAAQRDAHRLESGLVAVAAALVEMQRLLGRMSERCDPAIYFKRVRVPMSGWRANPLLPDGLQYEGTVWGDTPQQLYGETGAQSTTLHALDAALGITHEAGWLRRYLQDMQVHMPPAHRTFLARLVSGPSVRAAVLELTASQHSGGGGLAEAYDATLVELERFRAAHRGFAERYISVFSRAEVGTGGSDFLPALASYRQTTAAARVSGNKSSGCPLQHDT